MELEFRQQVQTCLLTDDLLAALKACSHQYQGILRVVFAIDSTRLMPSQSWNSWYHRLWLNPTPKESTDWLAKINWQILWMIRMRQLMSILLFIYCHKKWLCASSPPQGIWDFRLFQINCTKLSSQCSPRKTKYLLFFFHLVLSETS